MSVSPSVGAGAVAFMSSFTDEEEADDPRSWLVGDVSEVSALREVGSPS